MRQSNIPLIAIACGGTGGHLFPGMAVGESLRDRNCDVLLIVSQKEIDQQSLSANSDLECLSVPAIPLLPGQMGAFLKSFWKTFRLLRDYFQKRPAHAVLAMGGFTSAAPALAGRTRGAMTCLHEANSIPGKANRLLAPWVDKVFIGFSSAATRLNNRSVQFTGTPVRPQFAPADVQACRMTMGLAPDRPTLLVMGGSQGASAINTAVLKALPLLTQQLPQLQYLHITGKGTYDSVLAAYKSHSCKAVVKPFITEMEYALGSATIAVSRAGASSLAEMAAMRIPSILIPYPTAADDHQFHNARAFAQPGAARMLAQSQIRPELLTQVVAEMLGDPEKLRRMQDELEKWHFPNAANEIAESILRSIETSQVQATPHLNLSHG
ncbi:MAG: undecaprenyldiphospho-muramoylpentapeptide beta-N-acetylglucosaminyltransferase [Verrucomicrobiales bacterium]